MRSTNASSATATASPMPNSATSRWLSNTNATNTAIMIEAAAVITRAVSVWAVRTAAAASRVRPHSSVIRLTRKTW